MNFRTLLISFIFIYNSSAAQIVLYISPSGNDAGKGTLQAPLRTLEEVNERIREINNAKSDITVYLRGGIYHLEAPVVFDASLSRKNENRIIYKAYKNETPVISGGIHIDNWTQHKDGIYKAYVGNLNFRQLYVNGSWATRARRPNRCDFNQLISWGKDNVSPEINRDVIEDVKQVKGVEIIIQRHWNQSLLRIEEVTIDGSKARIKPMRPEISITFPNPPRQPEQYYHLENAYEFLDTENEWFLDTKEQTLYFKPSGKETMEQLQIMVPKLENLFILEGTPEAPIKNISFDGLIFEGTSWINPSLKGYIGIQAGVYAKENVGVHTLSVSQNKEQSLSSAILVKSAHNLIFENSTLRNLGGAGMILHSGVKNSKVSGNTIYNIAGNGIEVDWLLSSNVKEDLLCQNNVISNNYITRIGQAYYGSTAIFAGITEGTVIEHNHIEYVPHSAISSGWNWGTDPTKARKNIIRYNYISHAMNMLSDGAAIYTLGRQDSSRIEKNLIMNIQRSPHAQNTPVAAIYLDQGSDHFTIANNVFLWVDEKIHYSPNAGTNNTDDGNSEDLYAINQVGLTQKYSHLIEQKLSTAPVCTGSMFSPGNQSLLLSKVFPNPVLDKLHIVLYNNDEVKAENLEINVFSLTGSLVVNKNISLAKSLTIKTYDISLDEIIHSGVYILRLVAGNYTSSTKILVSR